MATAREQSAWAAYGSYRRSSLGRTLRCRPRGDRARRVGSRVLGGYPLPASRTQYHRSSQVGWALTGNDLVVALPKVYHMAHQDSCPSIHEHGLLSTSALLDLFEIDEEERRAIEAAHRPDSVTITHPIHGRAVVRDQKPMSDKQLAGCLTHGMTPAGWYRELNHRVFLWATRDRLLTMVGARAYRAHPQTVLTISMRRLVDRYADVIEVATINTGSTAYRASPRGPDTFVPLAGFDFDASRRRRGRQRAIAEVVVDYSLPDVRDLIVSVERWVDGRPSSVIWQPEAGDDK